MLQLDDDGDFIYEGSEVDIHLEAHWYPYEYNVLFENANPSTFTTNYNGSLQFGEVLQVSNPTKDGYTFTGWSLISSNRSVVIC